MESLRYPEIEANSAIGASLEVHDEVEVEGTDPDSIQVEFEHPNNFLPPVDGFHHQELLPEFILGHHKIESMVDAPLGKIAVTYVLR